MNIKTCPFCGKKAVTRVKRTLKRTMNGKAVIIPDVELLECSRCKERLFDSAAMDAIEAQVYGPPRKAATGR